MPEEDDPPPADPPLELPPDDPPDEPDPPEELEPPDELDPPDELLELLVAIFIRLDFTAMSMVLVICGDVIALVTSSWISLVNMGLDRVVINAFSNTDCPTGVINACCNWLDEMVSAIIFCILGVSISSRTAF